MANLSLALQGGVALGTEQTFDGQPMQAGTHLRWSFVSRWDFRRAGSNCGGAPMTAHPGDTTANSLQASRRVSLSTVVVLWDRDGNKSVQGEYSCWAVC